MKRYNCAIIMLLMLLVGLVLSSCVVTQPNDTFVADNKLPLTTNIKLFLEKGEKEGYDTLSANYFSDYKVNDIKKLLPTDPQNFKDDDIDIEYNSSSGFVTWDYITCNGTVQKRTGSKWGMDYGVSKYPFECANVIDEDRVAFSFCSKNGDELEWNVYIYEKSSSPEFAWSCENNYKVFKSAEEAENYINSYVK